MTNTETAATLNRSVRIGTGGWLELPAGTRVIVVPDSRISSMTFRIRPASGGLADGLVPAKCLDFNGEA